MNLVEDHDFLFVCLFFWGGGGKQFIVACEGRGGQELHQGYHGSLNLLDSLDELMRYSW